MVCTDIYTDSVLTGISNVTQWNLPQSKISQFMNICQVPGFNQDM